LKHTETWSSAVIADGVKGRSDTDGLVAVDHEAALLVARNIRHPWYRCQALSAVAESEPRAVVREALLSESLTAAFELTEPNRVVTVAGWPLARLIHTNPGKANFFILRLLEVISQEPHGLRKLDGLASILLRVSRVSVLRELVLPPFLAAATASTGWRTERIVAFTAQLLWESDPKAAETLLASRSANRFSRGAWAKIAAASRS
jgi:hypothetical protein